MVNVILLILGIVVNRLDQGVRIRIRSAARMSHGTATTSRRLALSQRPKPSQDRSLPSGALRAGTPSTRKSS